MSFGDRLKSYRKYHNYSQCQMAQKLGISQSVYSRYESGGLEPSITTLKKISLCLNVSVDYLLENYEDYSSQDIIDFEYYILHGNYSLYSKTPTPDDRQMISTIIKAIFDHSKFRAK